MPGVFISYRRADSGWVAADVAKELRTALDVRVFLDLGSIEPGERFRTVIEESLQRCVVMIVFLGKDWPGRLADSTRRIDQEDDVFRQEIEAALKTSMAVIPVLLGDLPQPIEAELPSALMKLASLQAHRIRPERKDEGITQLVDLVARRVEERRKAALLGPDEPTEDSFVRIVDLARPRLRAKEEAPAYTGPDRDEPLVYSRELELQVNAALVMGRPLMVIGARRSAARAIGRAVAESQGWALYEHSLGVRSVAQDLLYSVDTTRRLADAQMAHRGPLAINAYLEPGILWWALDPASAESRGHGESGVTPAANPTLMVGGTRDGAVLLLDGVDRVEARVAPDYFHVVITRSLLAPDIIERLAESIFQELERSGSTRVLDVREFLDVLRAVHELQITPGGTTWRTLLYSLGLHDIQ